MFEVLWLEIAPNTLDDEDAFTAEIEHFERAEAQDPAHVSLQRHPNWRAPESGKIFHYMLGLRHPA